MEVRLTEQAGCDGCFVLDSTKDTLAKQMDETCDNLWVLPLDHVEQLFRYLSNFSISETFNQDFTIIFQERYIMEQATEGQNTLQRSA